MKPIGYLSSILLVIFLLFSGMTSKVYAMGKGAEVPRVTKEQLLSMMGKPDVVILDVREPESWKKSKLKIQGAVREDPLKDVQGWSDKYPKDKTLVFYCSWPNEETSAWVARQFISRGYDKVFVLKGGWDEWEKAKFPVEPK
jgi:rhodanese-related sulfurtransferase